VTKIVANWKLITEALMEVDIETCLKGRPHDSITVQS